MQYDLKGNKLQDNNNKGKNDIITSVNTISEDLLGSEHGKSNDGKSIKSEFMARPHSVSAFSRRSVKTLRTISSKIQRGAIKSIRIVDQP